MDVIERGAESGSDCFNLRPGVSMPDWSFATEASARAALGAVMAECKLQRISQSLKANLKRDEAFRLDTICASAIAAAHPGQADDGVPKSARIFQ